MNKLATFFLSVFNYVKIIFIEGLLTILPITLTFALFSFFFKLFKKWLTPIYLLEPEYLQRIPHSEIILVITIILIIGAVFRAFFIRSFLHMLEHLLARIPLVNQVYSGIKQLVQAFTMPEKLSFTKVVYVEFPRTGIYSLGFLTGEVKKDLGPNQEQQYYSVFIPTTPNPTTGFLIVVPESECIMTDFTRQEAMSLIISGGIVQPERLQK